MSLCECGCEQEVKSGSRFIRGHQNRGKRNPFLGKHHTNEAKKKMSESKMGKKNPNFEKPLSKEAKQRLSEFNTGRKHTEETKLKQSESKKGSKNPNFGKLGINLGRKFTKEHCKKISESKKGEKCVWFGKKHTDKTKAKMSEAQKGKKNHAWRNGISYEPYCMKFNEEFKERVREFFERLCFNCGKNELEQTKKLSVHHVNYDKMVCCNGVKPLFVPLCASCHTKSNFNRDYWEEKFTQELMEKYDGECYLPKKQHVVLK